MPRLSSGGDHESLQCVLGLPHLSQEAFSRRPKQKLEPPQMAPLHVEEQQLHCELITLHLRQCFSIIFDEKVDEKVADEKVDTGGVL